MNENLHSEKIALQCREYESWKSMKGRGKGVELYSEVTAANNWILNKKDYLHQNGLRA